MEKHGLWRRYFTGLIIGALVSLACLAALPGHDNPRIAPLETVRAGGQVEESFFFRSPGDGIAVTHGGSLPLAIGPPGVAPLSEPAIERGFALLVNLRNAQNELVGFAVELEVHPVGDMLAEDLLWDTEWLLVLPGRGILVLHQQEHSGELGRKVIGHIRDTGSDWTGDWTVQTTVGPLPSGRGTIIGGTGEFRDARGSFIEIDHLTRYSVDNLMYGDFELRILRQGTE